MYADGTRAGSAHRAGIAGVALLFISALSAAAPAHADAPQAPASGSPPAPPAPASAAHSADELLAEAKKLFHDEHYPEAAAALEAAYRAEPKPLFLFNAGQAYRKGDRPREALAQYQRFLALAPDDPLAAEARGYIRDMHVHFHENE